MQYISDLQTAAAEAVRIANAARPASPPPLPQPVQRLQPVIFSRDGQYEQTISNVLVQKDAPVLIMGTGKAVSCLFDRADCSRNSTTAWLSGTAPTLSAPAHPARAVQNSYLRLCTLQLAKRRLHSDHKWCLSLSRPKQPQTPSFNA